MLTTQIQDIIARIPAWQCARSISVSEQPGGKTNRNYLVTVDAERFVLRVGGDNTASLGNNRATERQATLAASSIGIAPDVVAFLLPEGHMVTRFIVGKEWSPEDFRLPDIRTRVAATMRRVHALPPIEGVFDPYRDIEQRLALARTHNLELPDQLEHFLEKTLAIQAQRSAALAGQLSLCHNDPWHNNFLDDGTVRLLDWEFAGMGDPFFDLSSITAIYSPEEKTHFLECYFGQVTTQMLHDLENMIFVVVFWNATWALIQQLKTTIADTDFAEMTRQMFQFMQAHL